MTPTLHCRSAWAPIAGALLLAAAVPIPALAASPTAPQPATAAPAGQVDLLCDAVYLPARSSWLRRVSIHYDDQRVHQVRVDDLPVYAFQVQGTTVFTALDNERIQIDVAAQSWTSDFRGLATAQGRCERVPGG